VVSASRESPTKNPPRAGFLLSAFF